jgi:hypothetical protein
MLKALVFSHGVMIGRCDLYALDPPMGVVSGQLEPTPAYQAVRPRVDAVAQGDDNWDSLEIAIFIEDGGRRLHAIGGVMIEDMIDAGEPPTVVVCGVDETPEQFEAWFSADPIYSKYHGR